MDHWCRFYGVELGHFDFYPKIKRLEECRGRKEKEDFKMFSREE
jgi:hypothetical protein